MWVAMVVLIVLVVFAVVLVLLRIPNCVVLGGVGGKILMLGVKTAGPKRNDSGTSCNGGELCVKTAGPNLKGAELS